MENENNEEYEEEYWDEPEPLIGRKLPDLELDAYHEGKQLMINLADYRGKWLAIVFYPGDFTFICPTELEELADLHEKMKKVGGEVISVSTDSVYVHKAWHDTSPKVKKIKFPMVADPAGKLSRALGVYLEDKGEALRGSFIIDPDGVIKTMEVNHNDIGRSGSELLRRLEAAKFAYDHNGEEVCPANWHPGDETLKPGMDLVGKL